jgi:hypothetical protein
VPSISVHSYNTLQTCRRLFYWQAVRYVERVRDDGARGFGGMYHKGMEAWWRLAGGGDAPWSKVGEARGAALAAIRDGASAVDVDRYDVARAEAMMEGYHARWQHLEFELVGGGVESAFRVPLIDPDGAAVPGWFMSGRKDALVQFADRDHASVVDHKSTTQDIAPGSEFWQQLGINGQVSMYVDAARAADVPVGDAVWDASAKPDVTPQLATPEDQREYTQGKGCKSCGGSAKAGEVKRGAGVIEQTIGDPIPCSDCAGTGWKLDKEGKPDAPRLYAKQRTEDEPVEDFKRRVVAKLADNPGAYFQQGVVYRTSRQLDEARYDLVEATVEIDRLYARARELGNGALDDVDSRLAFPRNTQACFHMYGRRCDFWEVCMGSIVEPAASPLYRIRPRPSTVTPRE